MTRRPGGDVAVEARSWILAVEHMAAMKAGAPLEGLAGATCEALAILCMFAGRARAEGRTEAADTFLFELAPHLLPMLSITGLTLEDLRAVRPAGVA